MYSSLLGMDRHLQLQQMTSSRGELPAQQHNGCVNPPALLVHSFSVLGTRVPWLYGLPTCLGWSGPWGRSPCLPAPGRRRRAGTPLCTRPTPFIIGLRPAAFRIGLRRTGQLDRLQREMYRTAGTDTCQKWLGMAGYLLQL